MEAVEVHVFMARELTLHHHWCWFHACRMGGMSTRSWMGRGAVLVVGSVAIMGAGCASATRLPVPDAGESGSDEVQVGYGTINRRNVTTSVSSVQFTREDASGTSAFAELLNGRIAGVQVTRTGVRDYSIRIRGGEALVVVDGMISRGRAATFHPVGDQSIRRSSG
jgi:hypothetical protein